MSNLYRSSKSNEHKTIQLKPVQVQQEPEIHNDDHEVDTEAILNEKLAEAEKKLADAKQQAEQIINDAYSQVNQEREQFEQEKQTAYKQAHDQGYQEGFQKGEKQGEAQYNELIDKTNSVIEKANLDYHEHIKSAEDTILLIAMKASEKIVHQHLQEDESRLMPIIQEAIEEVSDQPEIKVYVHVNQYQMVLDYKASLQAMLNNYSTLSIYPKKSIKDFGCVIETEQGQIDTSIDTQLNELKRTLLNEVER
ncbi:flagellar assembly protein FliH [Alkalibacillus almallahensis]|uniref:flagellar assembly protein FliH n=1 Tax=Alkalibacillus almallahensis TaxID=1379154 RepID=UPI001420A966|nr:flagellar assembly protein FliH [Alkalibacillus almallahensis]NIK10786.1 flagellar assembly protein FliH [Alkalibacillus almallahensis]